MCSVGIAWKRDQTTQQRMSRTNQNDWRGRETTRREIVHIGIGRSETAKGEQPDKLRKTVRFEPEAPDTSSSPTMHLSVLFMHTFARVREAGRSWRLFHLMFFQTVRSAYDKNSVDEFWNSWSAGAEAGLLRSYQKAGGATLTARERAFKRRGTLRIRRGRLGGRAAGGTRFK